MQPISVAQKPETMHRDWRLICIVVALAGAICVLALVDLPLVEQIVQSRFVVLNLE